MWVDLCKRPTSHRRSDVLRFGDSETLCSLNYQFFLLSSLFQAFPLGLKSAHRVPNHWKNIEKKSFWCFPVLTFGVFRPTNTKYRKSIMLEYNYLYDHNTGSFPSNYRYGNTSSISSLYVLSKHQRNVYWGSLISPPKR